MENTVINFMPGPVNIHPDVKKVFYDTFLSHRCEKFYSDVKNLKQQLCRFVNAQNMAFFVGSGTLGNEVTAQYLKQLKGKGIILVNGEFGKRLKEQATHAELDFDTYELELGLAFNYKTIEQSLATRSYAWLWFVNCETSSGVLNNLTELKRICNAHNVKLAADCISSVANTEVDLEGVFMASCTSGKGLSSYPGIAMVFFNTDLLKMETRAIPKYFNLKHHNDSNSVPYTISTNLFYALAHAFDGVATKEHRDNIKQIGDYIYAELSALGFSFLGNKVDMMPGIISIICPQNISSYDLGVELEKNNFFVNYGGAYLRNANYFQICIMGHQDLSNAKKLVNFLKAKKLTNVPLQTADK